MLPDLQIIIIIISTANNGEVGFFFSALQTDGRTYTFFKSPRYSDSPGM